LPSSSERLRAALLLALLTVGCNSPRLRNFFPAGAPFERVFGQLYIDGVAKVSHYAVLNLTASPQLRAVSTGTIEYRPNFDGMGNCLLLRPKKYMSTPNRFDGLRLLPKPGAIVIGYCNLDEAEVKTAVQALYTARLSAAEAPAAATHFIAHDEGFTTLDVSADEADLTQSTAIGKAAGGKLFLAAFVESDDAPRRYVNPMPYLAGAVQPASTLDDVPPVLAEVVIETSASGTFGGDRQSHVPGGGDVVPGTVARDHLRVAVRATESARSGAPQLVPYRIVYELNLVTVSGGNVVGRDPRARGVVLLNGFEVAQAGTLAGLVYGSAAPAASDATTGAYYVRLAWHAPPAPEADDAALNALDPTARFALDLTAAGGDGAALFPSGEYELKLSVADAVNAPSAERAIRFTVGGSAGPPGDGEITYAPASGPLGTTLTITSATTGAFVAGDTTVSFTGTFTPDGTDYDGQSLGSTAPFTIAYETTDVTVIDGEHLSLRIGAVRPPLSVLTSPAMRLGHAGKLTGAVRFTTGGGGTYDHTLATFAFTVLPNGRFGQMQGEVFSELPSLPVLNASSAAEVAEAADFDRVVLELRVPDAPASPPATAEVELNGTDADGDTIDSRAHTLGLAGVEDGVAIYRSGEGGSRKLVFVTEASLAGEQGGDVLAVQVAQGGGVFLEAEAP
jgi:hypothetical protein